MDQSPYWEVIEKLNKKFPCIFMETEVSLQYYERERTEFKFAQSVQ